MALNANNSGSDDVQTVKQLPAPRPNTTGPQKSEYPSHRQHARVEDRIRQAKATGLRNVPCRGSNKDAAWLEVVMMATDSIA